MRKNQSEYNLLALKQRSGAKMTFTLPFLTMVSGPVPAVSLMTGATAATLWLCSEYWASLFPQPIDMGFPPGLVPARSYTKLIFAFMALRAIRPLHKPPETIKRSTEI